MVTVYQPQNLDAQQADGNILLTWTASLGATGYQIQRSADGVNFSNLAVTGVVPQYFDALPGVGITYYYQVAGTATAGGYASATLTFTGQPSNTNTVSIANVTLTAGTDFIVGSHVANTITNLVNAINANATLKAIVIATGTSTVVTISALANGAEGNGLQFSSTLANVTAVGFTNGITPVISTYSSVAQMVAAPPSEMSLYELRLRSQQCADRVNSQFVTTGEWNSFIRLAMYELYDILITSYEDMFASSTVLINTNGTTQNYPVPDGATNYLGGSYGGVSGTPALAFYKLAGMDLGINTSNNAWVTLRKFNFIDRNKYVYPNSTSTIYGVYNMSYRIMGNNINIIPTPAGNQQLRMWYSPKLPALLKDSDLTTLGYSGWLRYVIVRSAMYALNKEEGTDTSALTEELVFLKTRIEQAAQNRDNGVPDTISETRTDGIYGGTGWGQGGQGGW